MRVLYTGDKGAELSLSPYSSYGEDGSPIVGFLVENMYKILL